MQTYQRMKGSGVAWLGDIPDEWDILRVKQVFTRKSSKADQTEPIVLSLARSGVKIRDISSNQGQIAENYSSYNPVEPGDILLNPMDLQSGANCSISEVSGVISPAYVNLRPKNGYNPQFFDYYFKLQYWSLRFFAWGKGVSYENRWTLNTETLMNYPVIVPPSIEQHKIANYLDKETAKIDNLIAQQECLLELLEEKRRVTITNAVTCGLDPVAGFKDVNNRWLAKIPIHWEIKRLKYCCNVNNGADYRGIEAEDGKGYPVIGSGGEFTRASQFIYDGKSVLFGRKGTIDKPLYFEGKFWAVDTMFWTKIDEAKVIPKFLYYIALSIPYDYYQTKTALPSMTQSDILNHQLALPDIAEQKRILDYLEKYEEKLEGLKKMIGASVKLFNEYRVSLISNMVTGNEKI